MPGTFMTVTLASVFAALAGLVGTIVYARGIAICSRSSETMDLLCCAGNLPDSHACQCLCGIGGPYWYHHVRESQAPPTVLDPP